MPTAMLTGQTPGATVEEKPLWAGGPFAPAASVEIKLGYSGGEDVSVFKGVVTALAVHTRDGARTLEVTVKDKAIRLAGVRHSKIWVETTDADAISAIAAAAGLTMGDAPDTQPVHKALVQHEATDWDFILSRADALGLVVAVRGGTVSLARMDPSAAAAWTFTLGLDAINDVHLE